jgi:predicted DNA-binding protein
MKKQIAVRIPEELSERLADYQAKYRVQPSEVVRAALENAFAKPPEKWLWRKPEKEVA